MSFKKLAPLLLLTLSCSAESKCEDSLRCSGGQNEPTATAGNSNDSGTNTPQDSGTSRAPDGSPTNTTGVAGSTGHDDRDAGEDGGMSSTCTFDADCGSPVPFCSFEGQCVECRNQLHCTLESASRCEVETHRCTACVNNVDCDHLPGTPVCDAGVCVECLSNADCLSPEFSQCGTEDNCEPCVSNGDCEHLPGATICDAGTCVQCTGTEYEPCGTSGVQSLLCDSLNHTCSLSANPADANLCEPCISDAHCKPDQLCMMQLYEGEEVGYFCLPREGVGSLETCNAAHRPFIESIEDQNSIDGVGLTTCGLRVSTCVAANNQINSVDCAPNGSPDDSLCSFNGGPDGLCRLAQEGIPGTYRCTLLCAIDDDCPDLMTCKNDTPSYCIID